MLLNIIFVLIIIVVLANLYLIQAVERLRNTVFGLQKQQEQDRETRVHLAGVARELAEVARKEKIDKERLQNVAHDLVIKEEAERYGPPST